MDPDSRDRSFGHAWLLLCGAFVLHVADEALTGFLSVYNATAQALGMPSWLRFSTAGFLGLMIAMNVILLALTPFAFAGRRWMRTIGYVHAAIQIGNAAGHTVGTILGHTVDSVRFARPAPGFYSSPLLAAAAVYLLWVLRRTGYSTSGLAR